MKKQELFNNATEGFTYQRAPQQMGLYDAAYEHDACGVGMLVDIHGKKSHDLVESALKVLENMRHRGAEGADNKTGDGAGIMYCKAFLFPKKDAMVPACFFCRKMRKTRQLF